MNKQKIGRNDPCSCGSPLKFKNCCGGSQFSYIDNGIFLDYTVRYFGFKLEFNLEEVKSLGPKIDAKVETWARQCLKRFPQTIVADTGKVFRLISNQKANRYQTYLENGLLYVIQAAYKLTEKSQ